MAEEISIVPVEEEVPGPVLDAPEVVPVGTKFRRVIQPVDDSGTAIGSAHVYEADTEEELLEKMSAAIANGTKKIAELSRAVPEVESVPEGAIPQEEAPVWKPRDLTEEEKFIVKTDPEKAFDIQFEAKYGMTPEQKRKADEEVQVNARLVREQAETSMFTDDHPEYFGCKENKEAMIQYIVKHKLAWRATNLEIAYNDLSGKGLLTQKPIVTAPARTEQPQPKDKGPQFPTAIRNRTASATGPVQPKKGPSAEDVGKMGAAELQKLYPELQNAR